MKENSILERNLGLLLLFIVVAYIFSMSVRMYWPIHFSDTLSMYHNGQLMINTNDGYRFAYGARDIINGVAPQDIQRANTLNIGLSIVTAYITKITAFSLETIILYLSAIISSLIVIPIILTGRLLGNTSLGFLAALLGSIAWSYYNRTMVGYYDTDMFSVFLMFTIFYSFMNIIYRKNITSILFSTFLVLIYPFFYSQGFLIIYALFVLFALYMLFEYMGWIKTIETVSFKENSISLYISIILLSISLMTIIPLEWRVILIIIASILLIKLELKENQLMLISILVFIAFLFFGNIFSVIIAKVFSYSDRGLDAGSLQFYQVIQTVREAGTIPFETMANRISGSQWGVILSLMGYILLVFRHKQFIVALPLIGIGLFSLVGGLRFTVYAVPVAALSFVYLSFFIGKLLFKENKILNYTFVVIATITMLYPNIMHVVSYKVPTVLNKVEVADLVQLSKVSKRKDYTLGWWDYGYPITYYSNTSTLIDGGKHTHDNYIISKLLFSTSPQQVANLSKLAIETYVDSNYAMVADTIFKDRNPKTLLSSLKKAEYKLPKKTRDVYLYLPFRMLNIFPTVGVFGNLNLKTGKKERNIIFYPTVAVKQDGAQVVFQNGIVFDSSKGTIKLGKEVQKVYRFDQVKLGKNADPKVKTSLMHLDGQLCIVNLESYNKIIIMDKKTYNSTYVQMFMLGNYDKNLFELVVSSAYSKIYKVK